MFPEARFVHILRDPDQVARSLMHFDRVRAEALDPQQGVRVWRHAVECAVRAEQALGGTRVHRVYHQELKEQPEQLLRSVARFIDEPFSDKMLLPLAKTINSSKVRSDETLPDRVLESPEYTEAVALFERLRLHQPVPLEPDPAHREAWRIAYERVGLPPQDTPPPAAD